LITAAFSGLAITKSAKVCGRCLRSNDILRSFQ
jgi:hypothetical protein